MAMAAPMELRATPASLQLQALPRWWAMPVLKLSAEARPEQGNRRLMLRQALVLPELAPQPALLALLAMLLVLALPREQGGLPQQSAATARPQPNSAPSARGPYHQAACPA